MGFFSFAAASGPTRAHTAPYQMGTRGSFPGVKRPDRYLTTHLHLVPRLRIRGAISALTQYVFMAWCIIKHRDKFTFIFT
jgi:hypothetical protein